MEKKINIQNWVIRILLVVILVAAGGYYYFIVYPEKQAYDAYNAGVKLCEAGKLDESIGQFQFALSKKPQFSEAYNELAATYALQKNYDEAIRNIKKAIEINPSNGTAYYNLGTYYENKNMDKEAADTYRKFLSINPNDPQAQEVKNRLSVLEHPDQ